MELTIIIPTYNRKEILEKTLESIEQQNYPKDKFEVLVVDDGSTDSTEEIKNRKFKFKFTYLKQENQGPGIARNKGIKLAKGKKIAFIGDDIILTENWIREHLKFPNTLGLTLWHKYLKINKFMRYLAPNGPQFNYGLIKNKEDAGYGFFFTSNISLERTWLEKDNFDENFSGWGYEDIELGYRLQKKGLKLHYNPNALAYHYHEYNNPEEFLKKQINAAKMALYFVKKHPELKEELITKNKLKLYYWPLLIFTQIFNITPLYWKLKRRYYFSKGLTIRE